jgi:hypothetical protein
LPASLGGQAKLRVCLTVAKQADAAAPEIPLPQVSRSVSSDNTAGDISVEGTDKKSAAEG